MDPLQTYIMNVVRLGQRALTLHRRGYPLPDELAGPVRELLALEKELGLALAASVDAEAAADWRAAGASPDVEDVLVLDVEEEAGGGPAAIASLSDALPPLVVDLFDEEDAPVQRELTPPAQSSDDGLGVCRRCGEPLRPNSRYCHRCGQRHDQPF